MFWYIFCQGSLLLSDKNEIPFGERPPVALEPWHTKIQLPSLDEETCCAVAIDNPIVLEGWRMVALRESFDLLSAPHYRMAGKAAELLYWDANTKFCGVCGGTMRFHTEISKRCTNCGKEVWPQLATAVIVAITRNEGKEILLVRAKNFRGNYYGLVAGFVETGETLEEAVCREAAEETGLELRNVSYFGSQPWPYPCGLMVGYTAEYASGVLRLQHSELSDAGWYSLNNLPDIPGKVSLARQLIDHWKSKLQP